MLYAIIAAIVLVADQWLKYWVTVNITTATGELPLIPGVIKLVNVHNTGASFGMLSGSPFARWLFIGLAVAFVVLVLVLIARKTISSRACVWCAVLACAAALGNCIDRSLYGYVVDMFKLEFMDFAIFNVADAVLVVCCILFIVFMFVGEKKQKQSKSEKSREQSAETDEKPAKKAKKDKKQTAEKSKKQTAEKEKKQPVKKEKKSRRGGSAPVRRSRSTDKDSTVDSADVGSLELFEVSAEEEEERRIREDTDFWSMLKYATGKGPKPAAPVKPKPEPKPEPRPEPKPEPEPMPEPEPELKLPDYIDFGEPAVKEEESFDLDSILAEFKDI